MGTPKKKRRTYYCVRCGSPKTIRLEQDAKNSFTDRILIHCQNCRNTFTVFLPNIPKPKSGPPEGKPLYILDACYCSDVPTIRALYLIAQDRLSVRYESVCVKCGNTIRILQPMDEIEDILEMKKAFDRFIESDESWGLMAYLLE